MANDTHQSEPVDSVRSIIADWDRIVRHSHDNAEMRSAVLAEVGNALRNALNRLESHPEPSEPVEVTQAEAVGWERGMRDAAHICGSLAETTYDDTDAFEAATGCEAAIMSDLKAHKRHRLASHPEPSADVVEHRWSGWPGAWCLDCGASDPYEQALADGKLDEDPINETLRWLDPQDKAETEAKMICPEPGSNRHNPYVRMEPQP